MYIVSACLLGKNCKYSGGNNYNEEVKLLCEKEGYFPICPEELGGLPTPREPAEIMQGAGEAVLSGDARVLTKSGQDVTDAFLKGAKMALELAAGKSEMAILKARSPSCGLGKIYDGTFSGNLKDGNGVTTALFQQNGIRVITEQEIALV